MCHPVIYLGSNCRSSALSEHSRNRRHIREVMQWEVNPHIYNENTESQRGELSCPRSPKKVSSRLQEGSNRESRSILKLAFFFFFPTMKDALSTVMHSQCPVKYGPSWHRAGSPHFHLCSILNSQDGSCCKVKIMVLFSAGLHRLTAAGTHRCCPQWSLQAVLLPFPCQSPLPRRNKGRFSSHCAASVSHPLSQVSPEP